jgi:hypothetical protein
VLQEEAPSAKQEAVQLLGVLLRLFRQHSDATTPVQPELAEAWRGALPALLAGYSASLGACDRATLRTLRALDAALQAAEGAKPGGGAPDAAEDAAAEVSLCFSGPLAQTGCGFDKLSFCFLLRRASVAA